MKYVNIVKVALISLIGITTSPVTLADGKLNLYNWGDYINPEVLTRFTQRNRHQSFTGYLRGLMKRCWQKIQAGAAGYDIVFPSVHMHDIMFQLGLLQETNIGSHPDFKNIDPDFLRASTDPEAKYCLPLCLGECRYRLQQTKSWNPERLERFVCVSRKRGEDYFVG